MRGARIKIDPDEGPGGYHMYSRLVNGEMLFKRREKKVVMGIILQVADGCGIDLITFIVMMNHIHGAVRVPQRGPISDEELLRRNRVLYPNPSKYEKMRLERIVQQLPYNTPEVIAWRKRMLAMMGDISQFAKIVKQRITNWYNRTHNRFGPLWADRFSSTLTELESGGMRTISAYVDLNSIRAGLVKDPKDYEFGGYGMAVAGNQAARKGIMLLMGCDTWDEAQRAYRLLLFTEGSRPREKGAIISLEQLQKVVKEGGKLPLPDVLRCRVGYFTRGAVLGSVDYVEGQLARLRARVGPCPRTRVRPLPAVTDWGGLAVLKRIRGPGLALPALR